MAQRRGLDNSGAGVQSHVGSVPFHGLLFGVGVTVVCGCKELGDRVQPRD